MRAGFFIVNLVAIVSLACSSPQRDNEAAPPTTPAPPAQGEADPDGQRPMEIPRLEDMPVDDSAVANLSEMIERLNLARYHKLGYHGQGLKIAILDNGFTGLNHSSGKRLPPGLKVQPAPRPQMQDTTHGTKLTEVVYALATGSATYDADIPGPQLLLYNTNGFTNLKAAIDDVIAQDVDIVLYAQVWEYGGNGDGGGFINREVSRALDQGILWVNAAGNFGRASYSAPISILSDKLSIKLPYNTRYLRFTVPQDSTPVKVVLSWNDFNESQDYRTPQDLDLILLDKKGRELGASRLVQSGDAATPPRAGQASAHAREIVSTRLNVGTYYLRVEAQSQNFDAQSRLRVTIDGADVRLLEGTPGGAVLIPADNRRVLAVGASDVSYSSRSVLPDGRSKPEISLVSEIRFDDGFTVRGTSAATAIAVGALTIFSSAYGKQSYEDVTRTIRAGLLATPLRLP